MLDGSGINSGRNAIISALNGYRTLAEMHKAIENNRLAMAEREVRAAQRAYEEYMERYEGGQFSIKVPKNEYAKISHQVFSYPKKVERNHVFTNNNYYLCENINDNEGKFDIYASLPIVGNEDLIDGLRREKQNVLSNLSELQKTYIYFLEKSKIEVDGFVGAFLLLKDDIPAMEEMVLWMYEENPTPKEINQALINYCKMKNTSHQ